MIHRQDVTSRKTKKEKEKRIKQKFNLQLN